MKTMHGVDIQDYARKLFNAHGDRAVAEAAQKAHRCEKKGDAREARTWRRIESGIEQMRGPRVS
jgi:hypothetical protein